jgi:hypothetical protein
MDTTQKRATAQLPARATLKPPMRPAPGQTFVNWRVGGSRPKRKHSTLQAALAERKRILSLHPDAIVIVYELIPVYGRPPR